MFGFDCSKFDISSKAKKSIIDKNGIFVYNTSGCNCIVTPAFLYQ